MTASQEIANSNVNRNIILAGTSMATFTFLLFFLYPRYSSGEISPILFQLTLAVIVSVIFSLVISGLYYYADTLSPTPEQRRPTTTVFGKAEGFWLVGYSLLLLEPSLILFTVNLLVVALYGLALWLFYLRITFRQFRKLQPARK